MINAVLGRKLNQSQTFTKNGQRISVTRIKSGVQYVVDVRKKDRDGYNAIQIGFGVRKLRNTCKPMIGNLKKAGLDKNPPRFLKEINADFVGEKQNKTIEIGKEIKFSEVLQVGDRVEVTGTSKGKGFQGVVKRHGFAGGPRTHGQSDRERAPGSIGQTTTPGRVYKGKRMAGRMGSETITVKNLEIVNIDEKNEVVTVSGLIPGARNSLLVIKKLQITD